jgi:fatty-acyl-CoA synthase
VAPRIAYRHWVRASLRASRRRSPYGGRTAVIDERGTVTFAELDARADSIARGFTKSGINAGDSWVCSAATTATSSEVGGALAKVGAHAVYLNTGFASHQLQASYEREARRARPRRGIHTTVAVARDHAPDHRVGDTNDITTRTLDHLAARYATATAWIARNNRAIPSSSRRYHGCPKGARRDLASSGASALTLLDCIPYRRRKPWWSRPDLHSWGATNALTVCCSATHRARAAFRIPSTRSPRLRNTGPGAAAVPIMLVRVLGLPTTCAHSTTRRR